MALFRPSVTERRSGFTFSGTYNPFENPAVPLASVALDNFGAGTGNDAGQIVTQDSAAAIATFYRCMFLLSSVVAGCPIEVYRKRDHEQIDNPLFDPANDTLTYTQFELVQLIMVYRLAWGDSFVYKKRDGLDRIVDLKPLYPGLVKVDLQAERDPDTGKMVAHKVFKVKRTKPDGGIDETAQPQIFTDWEIMHIPGLGYDGLQGLPVTKLMSQTLGTAMAADKLAARFYSSGTQLGGIIKVKAPLTSQTQAEGIKSRWMQKNAGVGHAGEVAILDAETDWQSITIPPEQLQFLESRRWQTTEIARWFGVPPHLVGDVERSTSWGTGIEQQNLGLHAYTLSGHTTPIEQRLTREVVATRGQFSKFNLDSLMRGSTTERYQALLTATGGPWMTRNQARISENMKPLEGKEYDELLPPQGIGPAQQQNDNRPAGALQGPKQSGTSSKRAARMTERRDAAEDVFEQEAEDYPPSAMAWIHEARWKGPVDVPADHIDPDMSRMDKADPKHVSDFVTNIKKGKKLKPVILIKVPGKDKLQLIDGHHRYLADVEMKHSVRAFIGTVPHDKGPWDKMHSQQFDR